MTRCQHCHCKEEDLGPVTPYMIPVLLFLKGSAGDGLLGKEVKMPFAVSVQVDLCEECRAEALNTVLERGTISMLDLKLWIKGEDAISATGKSAPDEKKIIST
jgi:hypothetical protein